MRRMNHSNTLGHPLSRRFKRSKHLQFLQDGILSWTLPGRFSYRRRRRTCSRSGSMAWPIGKVLGFLILHSSFIPFFILFLPYLQPCYTSGVQQHCCITWESVRKAEPQSQPRLASFRICISTDPWVILKHIKVRELSIHRTEFLGSLAPVIHTHIPS